MPDVHDRHGPSGTHYGKMSPMPVEVIDAWGMGFNLGNALKYVARAGIKTNDPITDLRKAIWYINREISHLEEEHGKTQSLQEHGPEDAQESSKGGVDLVPGPRERDSETRNEQVPTGSKETGELPPYCPNPTCPSLRCWPTTHSNAEQRRANEEKRREVAERLRQLEVEELRTRIWKKMEEQTDARKQDAAYE